MSYYAILQGVAILAGAFLVLAVSLTVINALLVALHWKILSFFFKKDVRELLKAHAEARRQNDKR